MPIKAKTEYTKDTLLKFTRFSAVRSPFQVAFFIFLELFMLAMVLMLIVTAESSIELLLSVVLLAPLFLTVVPLAIWLTPKFTAKMSKNLLGCTNTYVFFNEELEIHSDLPVCRGESRVSYQHLDSVYETNDAFYLFISKLQALIVNKSDITEGTVGELQELLRKNIPLKKYHTKTKKTKLVPVMAVVMIAAVVISAVYAYLNPYTQRHEKTFSQSGFTITLTDDFREREDDFFTAVYDSGDMAVFVLKEEFSLFGNDRPSLPEYAGMIIEYAQLDIPVQEANGLTYFTYRANAKGKDFRFFSVVYMGSDAYWEVQFCCEAGDYKDLKADFIRFAKSVTVS